jgi:hypothetical protein
MTFQAHLDGFQGHLQLPGPGVHMSSSSSLSTALSGRHGAVQRPNLSSAPVIHAPASIYTPQLPSASLWGVLTAAATFRRGGCFHPLSPFPPAFEQEQRCTAWWCIQPFNSSSSISSRRRGAAGRCSRGRSGWRTGSGATTRLSAACPSSSAASPSSLSSSTAPFPALPLYPTHPGIPPNCSLSPPVVALACTSN